LHLTLKKETVRPRGANSLQQQARFDDFVREFSTERPHEALEMKCPADVSEIVAHEADDASSTSSMPTRCPAKTIERLIFLR
jgi:hypothetical protein